MTDQSVRSYFRELPSRYSALRALKPLFEAAQRDSRRNRNLHDLGLPGIYQMAGKYPDLNSQWAGGLLVRFKVTRLKCREDIFAFIERERQWIRDNWPETWPGERTVWSG